MPYTGRNQSLPSSPLEVAKGRQNPGLKVKALKAKATAKRVPLLRSGGRRRGSGHGCGRKQGCPV